MMQATGLIDTTLPGLKQKLEKDKKAAADVSNKSLQLERALDAALAGNVKLFVTTFAPAGVQSTGFDPSADQALFLRNGTVLQDWLKPAEGNLGDRLLRLDDSQQIAVELYLSSLSRRPTDEEVEEKRELLREFVSALARCAAQSDHDREMEIQRVFKNPITWENFPGTLFDVKSAVSSERDPK